MRSVRPRRRGVAVIAAVVALSACSPTHHAVSRSVLGDDAITVASFNFPESEILAEIYAQAIRAAGFTVDLRLDLGARELVEPALQRGLVEFVPEYAGSALSFASLGHIPPSPDPVRTHEALVRAMAPRGISVLASAPAENQNGIAVTTATADKYGLRTISDLGPIASELTFGGPVECQERPLCLPGLASVYGLRFAGFVPLDASGPLTAGSLASGQVDVALMFTTDGRIQADHFRLLTDDRGLQPAENVTPVLRTEVVDRFGPELTAAVDEVSRRLTTRALRSLNAALSLGDGTPATLAAGWLGQQGLTQVPE